MHTNNSTKCYVNSMNRNRQIEEKMVAHEQNTSHNMLCNRAK